MAANMQTSYLFFLLFLLLQKCYFANAESFLGVNFGQNSDDLPKIETTVNLLKSTSIEKVRVYTEEPANIMKAFANTNIGLVIGMDNGQIPDLATSINTAIRYVQTNVIPFYPATNIITIVVGAEVLVTDGNKEYASNLLQAMKNIQNALNAASLGDKIKVSTVHSMSVLSKSYPPSAGTFDPKFSETMKEILQFLSANGSPFMINTYPYFAYKEFSADDILKFCLFQAKDGQIDSGNGKKYTNMFDSQVDAVYSAIKALGFENIKIVVAETGWPHKGDINEPGASVDNAKTYVANLINHLKSKVGTPLMPGSSIDTYLFDLYDEDTKFGPNTERNFGLFKTDGSPNYDVGLLQNSQTPSSSSSSSGTPSPKSSSGTWCLPKAGVSKDQLEENMKFACGQGIDCSPIKQGGPCYEPNSVKAHAAYAMNLYYQKNGRNPWNCDFKNTGTVTSANPSYNECNYPGGSS